MKTEQNQTIRSWATDGGGFTLTDLVVLLGVVAVLILVEAPVLAGSRGQTKMSVCASHVQQITLACQIYANDNNEKLPVFPSYSYASWAWDLPVSVANVLLRNGVTTNVFYCPGTAPRFTDKENWSGPPYSTLWGFGVMGGTSDFHLVGFIFAFSGATSLVSATNQNTTMLPERIKNGSTYLPAPAASDRVLVADATISDNAVLPGYAHPENNYTKIQGGFYKQHVSPHLDGNIPAGGNVAFKDGHVAWRKFELMVPRTTQFKYFWW
jgi:competence protein ComGC